MRARAASALAATLALLPSGAVAATQARPLAVERVRAPAGEAALVPLAGTLVAALAPDEATLWLLVRPAAEPDGPRRLLRVEPGSEVSATEVLSGLGGWIKTLAAVDLGGQVELAAGGLGRLVDLGPLAAPTGEGTPLVEHPGFDLRSLAPAPLRHGIDRSLAAAEAGHLRLWRPAGHRLELVSDRPLPTTVERTAAGLDLASPPTTALATAGIPRWLAGPLPLGRSRLHSWLLEGEQGAAVEMFSALPGPEQVEQSWAVVLDGEPALVVHSQGATALDLFERQRLRVLPLAADRTRAGAAPTLAVELDAKRWQTTTVAIGDVDGDGHEDLVAAYPEGLTGGDLVIEVWRGRGGVRFETRAQRSDLDEPPEDWLLLPPSRPGQPMSLLLAWKNRVELRALAATGRRALAAAPLLEVPLRTAAASNGASTLAVGGEKGARLERRTRVAALGRAGDALLVLVPAADGADGLVIARARDLPGR